MFRTSLRINERTTLPQAQWEEQNTTAALKAQGEKQAAQARTWAQLVGQGDGSGDGSIDGQGGIGVDDITEKEPGVPKKTNKRFLR